MSPEEMACLRFKIQKEPDSAVSFGTSTLWYSTYVWGLFTTVHLVTIMKRFRTLCFDLIFGLFFKDNCLGFHHLFTYRLDLPAMAPQNTALTS